jgi:hypothetical protein
VSDATLPPSTLIRPLALRGNVGALIGAAAAVWLVFPVYRLVVGGYANSEIYSLGANSAPWRDGDWLSQLLLFFVRFLPGEPTQQLVLSFLAAILTGGLLGLQYQAMRSNRWAVIGAAIAVLILAVHPLVLYAVTAATLPIPIYVAFALLIPAIRRVAAVGDVQSEVTLGLTLPLLLLAGPETTPLIVPLTVLCAASNRDARQDIRAFLAMFIVAVVPSLVIVIGIVGFSLRAGYDLGAVLAPYAGLFAGARPGRWAAGLLPLALASPMALVPLVHCFIPDRRREIWSALAVVGFPVYLAVGQAVFAWHLPYWTPATALLFCFASWLTVTRLHWMMRLVGVLLMVPSVWLGFRYGGIIDDPAWLDRVLGPGQEWLRSQLLALL